MNKINICWFARGGDLDFFAQIAAKLEENDPRVNSYYVCDIKSEKNRLLNMYGVEAFVIKDYIESHNNTIIDEYSELSELEEKYNSVPFRKLVWGEMYEKNYDDSFLASYLLGLFRFWENVINNNDIQYAVSELPAILPNNVLWTICKSKDIGFVGFNLLALNDHTFRITEYNGNIGLKEHYSKVKVNKESDNYKKALQYYQSMIKAPKKPAYYNRDHETGNILQLDKGEIFQKPPSAIPLLKTILKKLIPKKISHSNEWIYSDTAIEVFVKWFLARYRLLLFRKLRLFEFKADRPNEKYFLYTLNMKHEWMIYSFAGKNLSYPLDTFRFISSTLPIGVKLYVKEHTAYFPQRPLSFYKELKNIPNVVLIDRRENTFSLIDKSEGVISIGGTVGWESFVFGKTVIALNETWYSGLPGVVRINGIDELLQYMEKYTPNSEVSQSDIIKAIYCLYELGISDAVLSPKPNLLSEYNIDRFAEYFMSSIIASPKNINSSMNSISG